LESWADIIDHKDYIKDDLKVMKHVETLLTKAKKTLKKHAKQGILLHYNDFLVSFVQIDNI
jgi:hypothetical protein